MDKHRVRGKNTRREVGVGLHKLTVANICITCLKTIGKSFDSEHKWQLTELI